MIHRLAGWVNMQSAIKPPALIHPVNFFGVWLMSKAHRIIFLFKIATYTPAEQFRDIDHGFGFQIDPVNRDVSLCVDIQGSFFYIPVPGLQLPMDSLRPNQIVIITGIHPLVLISRTLLLWLKNFSNDYKDSSVIPFTKMYYY